MTVWNSEGLSDYQKYFMGSEGSTDQGEQLTFVPVYFSLSVCVVMGDGVSFNIMNTDQIVSNLTESTGPCFKLLAVLGVIQ